MRVSIDLFEYNITDFEALYTGCSWMKEKDERGLKICRAQANLFVASLTLTECNSAVFLRRFMNSSVVERMDKTKNIAMGDYQIVVHEHRRIKYSMN